MPELLQPSDQVMSQTFWVQPLEEVAAQFLVVRSVLQQVIGDDKIVWPTATGARFLPRRAARRRYCAAG